MWTEAFVEYLRCEKNYSERTIDTYMRSLKAFELWTNCFDSEITWENLDKDVVRQWMVAMMDEGRTPRTVCRDLSALRTFYKFLLRRKLVTADPVHTLQGPKRGKALPYYVRESDMNSLLDSMAATAETLHDQLERLILLTFYSTGIRLSELVGLDWEQVDLTQKLLKVTGKRNKQRIVPFGEELLDAFEQYASLLDAEDHAARGAVFINLKTQRRIAPSAVQRIVKRHLSQVTTGKRSPHVLRHSFATSMLNHEADLQSVKELLGHESLATTEIYTHTTFEELRRMYNQAHPRA
ncbi:MAG: tyrosine-type recombinase/integrase [Bacteroidaceae bacterium]|nr:tyrosine-type recombinase/integrase [Bacteroidaceae bacterium]